MAAEARERETRPKRRVWTKPHRRHRAALGIGHVGLILGVVALALGGSGLAIALTSSGHTGAAGATGPTGATGAPGPRGPPGPGAVTGSRNVNGYLPMSDGVCTNFTGSSFSIAASGPGVVVLTGSVVLQIAHTSGYLTEYYLGIENASAPCGVDFPMYGMIESEPSGYYFPDTSLAVAYAVGAAGTYTYQIEGTADNTSSSDITDFIWASEIGTFYPS